MHYKASSSPTPESMRGLIEECKYYIEQNEVRLRSHSGSRLCQTLRRVLSPQHLPRSLIAWSINPYGSIEGRLGVHVFFIVTQSPSGSYRLVSGVKSMLPYVENFESATLAYKRAEGALQQWFLETGLTIIR